MAAAVLALHGGTVLAAGEGTGAKPPNIVFILADDLGYADIGCYGQAKIRTPNIDALAAQGMKFTQHYAGNAVCAPSRCVLMTGLHPGHAWVRNNREVKPEGQFSLPADAITIARVLKDRGYATGAFGKWGLGGPNAPGEPWKMGFDRFYGYLCQMQAHNYYPESLWDNDKVVKLDNPPIPLATKLPEGADPTTSESYAQYTGRQYSADLIAEQARAFLRQHKDGPFFLYWPTTVPHVSLQVPYDSRAEYEGKLPDTPYTGTQGYVPQWAPHATYAAMVTRFDTEVGRLMALLKESGQEDNTIVVFTSDNGPTHDHMGGADSPFFASADGLRGLKGSLYEGGIRVPLIVRWPGHVKPGSVNDHVTAFEDWFPTLAQIAGAQAQVPAKLDGVSFLAALQGGKFEGHPFVYREFPAYGGQQSIREGEWKLIRTHLTPPKKGAKAAAAEEDADTASSPTLELYNLKSDPGEQKNVAEEHPAIVERLQGIGRNQHVPSPNFKFAALDNETTAAKAD
jgi:arylsulfatase